jgi:glycosyltransferase involved in cell wall biosynthesis
MRIALNARFLLPGQLEGYGYFIQEVFRRLAASHPEHQFLLIFDRPHDQRPEFPSNVSSVVTGPPARHPILWKFWFDVKLPRVLKRWKADVLLSIDGICSLRTAIPQCLVIHDLAFLHFPSHIRKLHLLFYRRYTPAFIRQAKRVATVSEFSKRDIVQQYGTDPLKIDVVYSAAKSVFQKISGHDAAAVKAQYTGGKEFFLFVGAIHPRKNPVNLLKAFSIFKKRQKSNFKLLIAGRLAWKYDSFLQNLKNYKYRDDVHLLGYVAEDELVHIMQSAYALVYPSLLEGFGVPVLEAMQCGVPVITAGHSPMEEIAGEAALYADPENIDELAEKMMRLYKDEILRSQLIARGLTIALNYSWDRTADLLWQSILKTAD